jgi:hypothetical protein
MAWCATLTSLLVFWRQVIRPVGGDQLIRGSDSYHQLFGALSSMYAYKAKRPFKERPLLSDFIIV